MRRLVRIGLIGTALALLPMGLALGSAVLPTPTPAVGVVPSAQVVAHLNRLKSHGSSEIDRRLTSLQSAIDKLALSSELSDGDMKAMKALLDGEIKRLGTIKDQLSKETDLAAARVDVQAIVNEYPVYGLVLPKARLMTEADRFEAAGKQLQQVANKLSAKISAAKIQGKETAALEKQLATLKVTLTQAKPNYDGLPARILKLQTADYPASYKGLIGYRDSLSATRTQFKSAHDTISLMIVGLKNLKAATPTPSPSVSTLPANASPTATPATH